LSFKKDKDYIVWPEAFRGGKYNSKCRYLFAALKIEAAKIKIKTENRNYQIINGPTDPSGAKPRKTGWKSVLRD
jgi:hypothetical protein